MAATPRPPAGRQRRREDPSVRREQILSAARTCFANAGFKSTTVDDIAAEAGVSVGLLYRIFASKTAIIEAIILEQVEAQIAQAFELISTSPKSGIDRAKVLKSFEGAALDFQQLALTFEIAAEACRNQPLRAFMQSRRADLYADLMARLAAIGMDRKTAEQKFAELDLVGAVGSGAVIQGLTSQKMSVAQTVKAVFKSLDHKRSDA
jgi:TetR/AcrR family transcriptional regulator, repressor for uid operon